MGVEFIDNRTKVKSSVENAGIAWLYEACGEIEAQTKRNSKVVSGKTKGSYFYMVDENAGEGYVGSSDENAVWEEFGTGEYALGGDGRKNGWWIKVGYGRGEISPETARKYRWEKVRRDKNGSLAFVFTRGKKARRPLFKAFTSTKNLLKRLLKEMFGSME